MTASEILTAVKQLAQSQGFYGRILGVLESNTEALEYLEQLNFKDSVDMVLYFEC